MGGVRAPPGSGLRNFAGRKRGLCGRTVEGVLGTASPRPAADRVAPRFDPSREHAGTAPCHALHPAGTPSGRSASRLFRGSARHGCRILPPEVSSPFPMLRSVLELPFHLPFDSGKAAACRFKRLAGFDFSRGRADSIPARLCGTAQGQCAGKGSAARSGNPPRHRKQRAVPQCAENLVSRSGGTQGNCSPRPFCGRGASISFKLTARRDPPTADHALSPIHKDETPWPAEN